MLRKFLSSLKHARRGLKTIFFSERNFRNHLSIAIVVLLFAWWRKIDLDHWLILLLVIALVLILEIINSSLERLVDILAPQTHQVAKEIKDSMAAMVLVAAMMAVLVGIIIFFF
ncbi:diacylglycerol kinase family protein [Candidatus Nomurabacteria bacterium]|nr:diacylglycerol kinase family protein [Candidatus Nomurabacteria bacterium]